MLEGGLARAHLESMKRSRSSCVASLLTCSKFICSCTVPAHAASHIAIDKTQDATSSQSSSGRCRSADALALCVKHHSAYAR